ncbi:MAG: hypothetical protein LQ338_000500 [Usnochroma carphineum]|nr:MAG: hypothetical protein LQ338_000500 [Usnochroma carphineum]
MGARLKECSLQQQARPIQHRQGRVHALTLVLNRLLNPWKAIPAERSHIAAAAAANLEAATTRTLNTKAQMSMLLLEISHTSTPAPETYEPAAYYVEMARASAASGSTRPSVSYGSFPATASPALRAGSSLAPQTSNRSYPEREPSLPATQVGITNYKGRLDPNDFHVRTPPSDFFKEGKVFIKLHTEDAGATANDHSSFGFSTVAYEELAYSQLRRFVVVKAKPQENYCLCVPITTYSGKGAGKKGVDQKAHTIIYTGSHPPAKLSTEKDMRKTAIQVIPSRQDEKLDPKSRVNLGKMYTVEWNTKVKGIGQVEKNSLVKLLGYWRQILNTARKELNVLPPMTELEVGPSTPQSKISHVGGGFLMIRNDFCNWF